MFYLTDGTIGLRASVDYGNPRGRPGFFSRSLYGRGLTTPRQLVNTLNPSFLALELSGATLEGGETLALRPQAQTLDLRYAYFSAIYSSASGANQVIVRVTRFLPTGRCALVTIIDVDATDTCRLRVQPGISFGHGNSDLAGRQDGVRLMHLQLSREFTESDLSGVVCINRSDGKLVGACSRFWCADFVTASSPRFLPGGIFAQDLVGEFPSGHSQIILVSTYQEGGLDVAHCDEFAADLIKSTRAMDFNQLVAEHRLNWNKFWVDAPAIESGSGLTLASRYGAFQMLQMPDRTGSPFNIPARGLSSEYHSGHFFFNTEFFVAPYFIYMEPKIAKSMLRHRIQRLPSARAFAVGSGFQGARFPEESDDLGNPAAPREIRNLFSGESIWEWSGVEVVHTTADVLYAISKYVAITGDREFLVRECPELLVECATYLASVLKWDDSVDGYSSHSVMGFDEFHYHVDHHYATNWICSWGLKWVADELGEREELLLACEQYARSTGSDLRSSLGRWVGIAKQTYLPEAGVDGVLPVFADYFQLPEQSKLTDAPLVHSNISAEDSARADRMEPFRTRLTKQADIVFLMTLFPEHFSDEEVAKNLRFYEPRTVHGSSLSMTAHAAAALRVKDDQLAIDLMRASLSYNLGYLPRADYTNGVHIAAYAGAFLVLVENVLGLTVNNRPSDSLPAIGVRLRVPIEIERFAVTVSVLEYRLSFSWNRGVLSLSHAGNCQRSLAYSFDGIKTVLLPGSTHRWHAGATSPAISEEALWEAQDGSR